MVVLEKEWYILIKSYLSGKDLNIHLWLNIFILVHLITFSDFFKIHSSFTIFCIHPSQSILYTFPFERILDALGEPALFEEVITNVGHVVGHQEKFLKLSKK